MATGTRRRRGPFRICLPGFRHGRAERALVEKLEELAKDKGVTASELALAWVLAQGDNIVPIPGTKHRKYVEQNAEAVNIALSDAELKQIDEVFSKDAASGLRYPEEMMTSVHA